jgi:Na+/H+ antiporter NhaD/arsenite permease-like protein
MNPKTKSQAAAPTLFLPTRRAAAIVAGLGLATLGAALWLRYGVVQDSEIGVACEEGERSLLCTVRLAVILLFVRGVFGWVALVAASINLWRPHAVLFGIGVVFALAGLVLYNTRVAALAVPLLVLSLARPAPGGR